jgi:hypothetical protein
VLSITKPSVSEGFLLFGTVIRLNGPIWTKSAQFVKSMNRFTDNGGEKASCTSSKYALFGAGTAVLGFTDDSRICTPFLFSDSLTIQALLIAVGESSLACGKREMLNTLSELLTEFAVAWVSLLVKMKIHKSLKHSKIQINFPMLTHDFSGWHMPCI